MKITIEYDSGEVRSYVCRSSNPDDVLTIKTEDPAHGDEYFEFKAEAKSPVSLVQSETQKTR